MKKSFLILLSRAGTSGDKLGEGVPNQILSRFSPVSLSTPMASLLCRQSLPQAELFVRQRERHGPRQPSSQRQKPAGHRPARKELVAVFPFSGVQLECRRPGKLWRFCLFEGNPVGEGTTRRGTATPVHRPQRPAGSTHSSTGSIEVASH